MARKKRPAQKTDHQKMDFPKGASLADKGRGGDPGKGARKSEESAGDYYRLKKQAVEDLVTASPENSPPVSKAELRKYHAAPGIKVSDTVKAILIKIWFAGVICYFFVWGLSTFTLNQWDLMLILSMMFPGENHLWLIGDLIYAALLVACTVMTYSGINALFTAPGKEAALGVEPILFGVIIAAWDLIFLFFKHLMKKIVKDARHRVSQE